MSAEENFDEVWPAVIPGGSFQKAIVYPVCVCVCGLYVGAISNFV